MDATAIRRCYSSLATDGSLSQEVDPFLDGPNPLRTSGARERGGILGRADRRLGPAQARAEGIRPSARPRGPAGAAVSLLKRRYVVCLELLG